jgi:O-methyltransferase involved in polyketide biosynthesis
MGNAGDLLQDISDVSESLLLPLYARALESRSLDPILVDERAVEITQELNLMFERSGSPLHEQLSKGKLRRRFGDKLSVALALRTRRFDRYCMDYMKEHPEGTIVELGCGFSTRFDRVDNGKVRWFDLDLPEVIRAKEKFFSETERFKLISSSVLDHGWMDQVVDDEPPLFVAEGLLMYLHGDEVKDLVLALQARFPSCELVCEVAGEFVVRALKRKIWRRKFQRDYRLGEGVSFHFGVTDGHEMERWKPGIQLLDEWTYFDERERRLGWMRFLGRSEKMRKAQWVVHYRLG